MDIYDGFAELYDELMDNVDYDEWAEYIKQIWQKFNAKHSLVCDLGCGTGNITQRLMASDCDVIGIDISEEMLSVARQKEPNALFLCQDMTEFELYGTVDSVISVCDSINYITDIDKLSKVFSLVSNYLEPSGLFIFDINTVYKFKESLADNSFCETREDCAFIWENYYDEDERINEYNITFFAKNEDGSYRRFEETHYEAAYSSEEIKRLLAENNLRLLAEYDAFTFEPPSPSSERICFVARETLK